MNGNKDKDNASRNNSLSPGYVILAIVKIKLLVLKWRISNRIGTIILIQNLCILKVEENLSNFDRRPKNAINVYIL